MIVRYSEMEERQRILLVVGPEDQQRLRTVSGNGGTVKHHTGCWSQRPTTASGWDQQWLFGLRVLIIES